MALFLMFSCASMHTPAIMTRTTQSRISPRCTLGTNQNTWQSSDIRSTVQQKQLPDEMIKESLIQLQLARELYVPAKKSLTIGTLPSSSTVDIDTSRVIEADPEVDWREMGLVAKMMMPSRGAVVSLPLRKPFAAPIVIKRPKFPSIGAEVDSILGLNEKGKGGKAAKKRISYKLVGN